MRMFNVVPRLIKNTVKNLTHFTCNSPVESTAFCITGSPPEAIAPFAPSLKWYQRTVFAIAGDTANANATTNDASKNFL